LVSFYLILLNETPANYIIFERCYWKQRGKLYLFVADKFWVGASDVEQQPGHFVWQSDGTKVDEALWKFGYPDRFGAGRETCVYFGTESGRLFDYRCNHAILSFICEVAQKDLPCHN